jgi:uncharacterized membrane protein
MSMTSVLGLAFAIGVIAGLRAMTAPAVVSWGAHLRWLNLGETWLGFLATRSCALVLSVLAIGEIINDKLPKTPSRKAPASFGFRIVSGAFSGLAVATAGQQSAIAGAVMGGLGAVAGTLGGYEVRSRLVKSLGVPDLVIALIEDAVAVGGGFLIVSRLS